MTDRALPPSPAADDAASATRFLGTLALLLVSILALFSFDLFLARRDRADGRSRAQQLFRKGHELIEAGDPAEAVKNLRDAVALSGRSPAYSMALARAELATGRADEAERTLDGVLGLEGTSGAANLELARIMVATGRFIEGTSYYHRAIYGRWETDSAGGRARARIELIELLAARGAREVLLAELLPFEQEAGDDPVVRQRLGDWFLQAGSPTHAAVVYQTLADRDPRNVSARAGLGHAAEAMLDYPRARRELALAARIAPEDKALAAEVLAIDSVLALDPSVAGLSPADRYRRSRLLLIRLVGDLDRCPALPQSVVELTSLARERLRHHLAISRSTGGYQDDLERAEQLWLAIPSSCTSITAASDRLTAQVLEVNRR